MRFPFIRKIVVVATLLTVPFLLQGQMEQHRWKDRILLIFAKMESLPDYQQQLSLLNKHSTELADRDLLQYHLFPAKGKGPEKANLSAKRLEQIRQQYNPQGADFLFILIGKDGGIKLRSEKPVLPEQLYGLIDQMPMRRAEMRRKDKG